MGNFKDNKLGGSDLHTQNQSHVSSIFREGQGTPCLVPAGLWWRLWLCFLPLGSADGKEILSLGMTVTLYRCCRKLEKSISILIFLILAISVFKSLLHMFLHPSNTSPCIVPCILWEVNQYFLIDWIYVSLSIWRTVFFLSFCDVSDYGKAHREFMMGIESKLQFCLCTSSVCFPWIEHLIFHSYYEL